MDPLKLVAQALGLAIESPVEKILEVIGGLKKQADEGVEWEKEAHENLAKMEETQVLVRKNSELQAEIFMKDAVQNYQIDKAEADVLKEMFLQGRDGRAAVEKLLATRKRREYLTRKSALTGQVVPVDPIAERDSRVAEAKVRDPKLTDAEATKAVFAADRAAGGDLFERVSEAKRASKGGGR